MSSKSCSRWLENLGCIFFHLHTTTDRSRPSNFALDAKSSNGERMWHVATGFCLRYEVEKNEHKLPGYLRADGRNEELKLIEQAGMVQDSFRGCSPLKHSVQGGVGVLVRVL